jgi:hypothetical protein
MEKEGEFLILRSAIASTSHLKRCKPKIVFVQFGCSLKVRKSQKQFFLNSIAQKATDIFSTAFINEKRFSF